MKLLKTNTYRKQLTGKLYVIYNVCYLHYILLIFLLLLLIRSTVIADTSTTEKPVRYERVSDFLVSTRPSDEYFCYQLSKVMSYFPHSYRLQVERNHFEEIFHPYEFFITKKIQSTSQCNKYYPYNKYCPNPKLSLINRLGNTIFSNYEHGILIEILENLGITRHHYNLADIVSMTQKLYTPSLDELQRSQMLTLLENEGVIIEETYDTKKGMKKNLVELLNKLHFYTTLMPEKIEAIRPQYTLLLGGSIQQMQMRFLSMIAYFSTHFLTNSTKSIPQYTVDALTCDRIVNTDDQSDSELEIDKNYKTIWFEVENGLVQISDSEFHRANDLTEDTAFKAILYAVKRMCNDPSFFEKHRRSTPGFHQKGHYPDTREISYFYAKREFDYELTDQFYKTACQFINHHKIQTFSTPQELQGLYQMHRPTTKETVKNWITTFAPCDPNKICRILIFTNQPYATYQQVATLQAFSDQLRYQKVSVSVAAIGTSFQIPTNIALDSITRILYLLLNHPKI